MTTTIAALRDVARAARAGNGLVIITPDDLDALLDVAENPDTVGLDASVIRPTRAHR